MESWPFDALFPWVTVCDVWSLFWCTIDTFLPRVEGNTFVGRLRCYESLLAFVAPDCFPLCVFLRGF